MPENIAVSYMGTKNGLLDHVERALPNPLAGPVSDVFAGTCALALKIAQTRGSNVWVNDTQLYAAEFARAHFVGDAPSPDLLRIARTMKLLISRNFRSLKLLVGARLEAERRALARRYVDGIAAAARKTHTLQHSQEMHNLRNERARNHFTFPYCLFTAIYAETYIGLSQAMALDSIRYAIDVMTASADLCAAERRWCLLAQARVLQRIATTTGHFAQYLTPNERYNTRFISQRLRNPIDEFFGILTMRYSPIGTKRWRRGNQVDQKDALELLHGMRRQTTAPQVVFADPPYTKDQYSRFYHLLDTLIAYDYPRVESKARYRIDRFTTSFSHRKGVVEAFHVLARNAAALGSTLILTYPRNGLLQQEGFEPDVILSEHFSRVEIVFEVERFHSTMGSSKGSATQSARELIIRAA